MNWTPPASGVLARFAHAADPRADEVAEALFPTAGVNADILALTRYKAHVERGPFQRFLDDVYAAPARDGLDDDAALAPGRRFLTRNAPFAGLVFVFSSLLEVYTIGHIAPVLAWTGRLKGELVRRLYETAQMVRNLLLPGGLRPGYPGHESLARVRLLHAAVRAALRASGHWDAARGAPINQVEMAFTLLAHGHIVLRGLKHLGIEPTPEEEASYHLLWRQAGKLLGVDDALLTRDTAGDAALYDAIKRQFTRVGAETRMLTDSIFDELAGKPPYFLSRAALRQLSYALIGKQLAADLGIAPSLGWRPVVWMVPKGLRVFNGLQQTFPSSRRVVNLAGTVFIEGSLYMGLDGWPAQFIFKRAA